jgi:hypothetical protein
MKVDKMCEFRVIFRINVRGYKIPSGTREEVFVFLWTCGARVEPGGSAGASARHRSHAVRWRMEGLRTAAKHCRTWVSRRRITERRERVRSIPAIMMPQGRSSSSIRTAVPWSAPWRWGEPSARQHDHDIGKTAALSPEAMPAAPSFHGWRVPSMCAFLLLVGAPPRRQDSICASDLALKAKKPWNRPTAPRTRRVQRDIESCAIRSKWAVRSAF